METYKSPPVLRLQRTAVTEMIDLDAMAAWLKEQTGQDVLVEIGPCNTDPSMAEFREQLAEIETLMAEGEVIRAYGVAIDQAEALIQEVARSTPCSYLEVKDAWTTLYNFNDGRPPTQEVLTWFLIGRIRP